MTTLFVPQAAMSHVVAAAELELARLEAVHGAVGDAWPADFDANDIPMLHIIIDALQASRTAQGTHVDLSGKPLSFLLATLSTYVETNLPNLSFQ